MAVPRKVYPVQPMLGLGDTTAFSFEPAGIKTREFKLGSRPAPGPRRSGYVPVAPVSSQLIGAFPWAVGWWTTSLMGHPLDGRPL